MVHLVTGYAGYEHITSADQRAFNASFFGDGQYVMEYGNQFAASIIDNNTVRVLDGEGLMFGGHFRVGPNSHEDITIKTGTAGTNRIDLIVATYRKNEDNGTESVAFEVIEGVEANSASVPKYTTGSILEGAIFNQMPFYKVNIEGVVLKSIEPLFETIPSYAGLAEQYAKKFQQKVDAYKNTGIYHGIGNSYQRSVNIGTGVNAVLITGQEYMAIVTAYGAIYKKSTETTVQGLSSSEVRLVDGFLITATTSDVVNKSGAVYTYQAL